MPIHISRDCTVHSSSSSMVSWKFQSPSLLWTLSLYSQLNRSALLCLNNSFPCGTVQRCQQAESQSDSQSCTACCLVLENRWFGGFPSCSVIKNPPVDMGREDSLEKEMATHSSFLLGNPMDRRTWQAQSMGSQRVRRGLATKQQQHINYISIKLAEKKIEKKKLL